MSVASIVCVDGELDVHDTASAAVTAAIERRREAPTARIGISVGDLEIGDPLGFAKRLCELAAPSEILVSDAIRRATRDEHAFVDLGAISTTGFVDRIHVFEVDGATTRERTVLAIQLRTHGRIGRVGHEAEEAARYDAELRAYDRRIWGAAFAHRGFVERARGNPYLIAFADPVDAFRTALASIAEIEELRLGTLHIGVERGTMTYMADHWRSNAWVVAEKMRIAQFGCLASSMTVVDAIGIPALRDLGLVIEVVEEFVQKGIPDKVRVAQLRMA